MKSRYHHRFLFLDFIFAICAVAAMGQQCVSNEGDIARLELVTGKPAVMVGEPTSVTVRVQRIDRQTDRQAFVVD